MLFDAGCVVCGGPRGPVCARCCDALQPAPAQQITELDSCRAGFVLDDRSLPIIAALKYRRQRRVAAWLADAVVELVPRAGDVITWIPATPARRRSRGFDQAGEIARALSKATGVPRAPLLVRHRHDDRQTGRTRLEREAGPELRVGCLVPPFVVLVDDVMTTGSSMRVAASALRVAGANRVVGVAVAATPLRTAGSLRPPTNASIIDQWT